MTQPEPNRDQDGTRPRLDTKTAATLAALSDKYSVPQSEILAHLVARWVLAYDPDVAGQVGIVKQKAHPFQFNDEVPMQTVWTRPAPPPGAAYVPTGLPDDPNAPQEPVVAMGSWGRVTQPIPVGEAPNDTPPSKRKRMVP